MNSLSFSCLMLHSAHRIQSLEDELSWNHSVQFCQQVTAYISRYSPFIYTFLLVQVFLAYVHAYIYVEYNRYFFLWLFLFPLRIHSLTFTFFIFSYNCSHLASDFRDIYSRKFWSALEFCSIHTLYLITRILLQIYLINVII